MDRLIGARGAIALSLVAMVLVTGDAEAREADPFSGDGSWVWYVSASGGSGEAIARTAERRGLETVFVKSSDGVDRWSQFSRGLVRALHRRDINACAWSFVYGDRPGAEARATARAARRGADCIVIDAESAYEGRYRQAYAYVRKLRRRIGRRFPLGLSSFPYVDYHLSFPYSVFLGRRGATANLPQIYWKAIGTSVAEATRRTFTWNRPYGRPLYPLGQTWQDPGRKILLFRKYLREYGAGGVSWWSWQETNAREWRLLSRPLKRGVPGFEAEEGYPRLQRGDKGDLVVLAQELLRAWGVRVRPDGGFGRKMEAALIRFQDKRGLRTSGRIGASTWRLLQRRRPDSTNWSRRRVPRALAGVVRSRRDPAPDRFNGAGVGSDRPWSGAR